MLKKRTENEIDLYIRRYPALSPLCAEISAGIECMAAMYRNGGKLLVCGNGGSASDSLHIVGELMKNFAMERKIPAALQKALTENFPEEAPYYIRHLQGAVPAVSLVGETSLMTAYGNDSEGELVFAQQVVGYGRSGDVLLAISTSGNSENVLHAAKVSKALGLTVISLTGRSGGELRKYSDILLNVPADVTHQVQELHLPVYHLLCCGVELECFGGP